MKHTGYSGIGGATENIGVVVFFILCGIVHFLDQAELQEDATEKKCHGEKAEAGLWKESLRGEGREEEEGSGAARIFATASNCSVVI